MGRSPGSRPPRAAAVRRGAEALAMAGGPGLEEREVPLPRAAREEMPPALQQQPAPGAEAEAGVGAVHLLLDDQMAADQGPEGDAVEILVPGLSPRALEV